MLSTVVIPHQVKAEQSMGNATLEKLRSEALGLPGPERAQLAHDLVESLDAPWDSDATEAWERELRRLGEIEAGTAVLIDREELRRRMRARIARA